MEVILVIEKILKDRPPAFKKFCDKIRNIKMFDPMDAGIIEKYSKIANLTMKDMWKQKTGYNMTKGDIEKMLGPGLNTDDQYGDDNDN